MFIASLHPNIRQRVAGDTQPLERVFGLVIERRGLSAPDLGASSASAGFIDAGARSTQRLGDVVVTSGDAIAVLRAIERDDRNVFRWCGPDVGWSNAGSDERAECAPGAAKALN